MDQGFAGLKTSNFFGLNCNYVFRTQKKLEISSFASYPFWSGSAGESEHSTGGVTSRTAVVAPASKETKKGTSPIDKILLAWRDARRQ